jgi:hypothetical protein
MKTVRPYAISLVVALCLILTGTTAQARRDGYDRRVTIINDSSHSILQLFGSPVSHPGWENDILGAYGLILPGHQARIDFDDNTGACKFDLKAVMDDGTEVVRRRVDICAMRSWTIED